MLDTLGSYRLTVTGGASGSGNGTISYSASLNTGGANRNATITAGGKIVSVTQAGSCTYALGRSSTSVAAAGGASSVAMTAAAGCTWTSSSNSPSWLKILSGVSGNGNGWVTYNVLANKGATRTGTITAGGQTFTVTQSAPGCTFSISPASTSAGSGGGTFTVGVTAGTSCGWTALSNVAWITVSSGASGSGSGTVSLRVAANTGTSSRTGTVTIAGKIFTVTEAATAASSTSSEGCTYQLGRTSSTYTSAGATDSVKMTAPSGCTWRASSDSSWLLVLSGSGNGAGWVSYSVAKNTGGSRTGRITVGGQVFTVSQP